MNGSNTYLKNRQKSDLRLLFIGDPNIGRQGFEIVQRYFTNASCAIWQRGDTAGAQEIRMAILSSHWNILLSFYNDLLFSEAELNHTEIALNIHPASPRLRGVGYDSLPLILEHPAHGVTLHSMVADPDAGKIIDVIEEPLPPNLVSSELRLRNQGLCLRMLEKIMPVSQRAKTAAELNDVLDAYAENIQISWSSEYFSRKRLATILAELRRVQPTHRALR